MGLVLPASTRAPGSGTQEVSLNSYGYNGVKAMYGPMFGSPTKAVYDAANRATTTNTIAGN